MRGHRRFVVVGVAVALITGVAGAAALHLAHDAEAPRLVGVGPFAVTSVPAGFVARAEPDGDVLLSEEAASGARRQYIQVTFDDRGASAPGPDDIGGPGRAPETVNVNGVAAVHLVQRVGPEVLHRLAWSRDGYLISVVVNAPADDTTARERIVAVARGLRRG